MSLLSKYIIILIEQLESTNTWLMEHTAMEEGTVIIADEQTGGKGRNGRHYHSPKGSGIYLSLLLKPDGALHDVLSLTAATAVACLKAIEEVYGLACSIKWLNDILYEGKKITGIFQPHLYTRTRDFADDFAASLSLLDELILLDIYPAREKPIPGVTSQIIFDKVTIPDKKMIRKEELLALVEKEAPAWDVVLMLGAGDIDRLIEPVKQIVEKL